MTEEREAGGDGRERPQTAADRRGRRSGSSAPDAKGGPTAVRDARPTRAPLPARIVRFLREVVAELRKVVWPTRKQLVTYFIVVLIFVAFMIALIAGMDYVFGELVRLLFG